MFFKLIDIKKYYLNKEKQKMHALDGINLDINESNFISFVGPSGAGKTTLLLIIAGLIRPSSGDIYFDNKKLTKLPDHEWATIRKNYISIIFQKKIVIPHLTVIENILTPLSFSPENLNTDTITQELNELLELFELAQYKNVYPSALSGGELQRLMIVRALITKPKILLADEPTGDLDIPTSLKIMKILKDFNKKGLNIVMVTHNKELANIAKNIYEIKQGKIDKIIK